MQKHFLAVVADEARAIFYTHDTKSGPLTEWRSFDNDVARSKSVDLVSDRGGRSFDSHGQGRHSVSSDRDGPKELAATRFAKRIAGEIAADVNTGTCRGYALVAAPRFLGELRDAIATSTHSEPYAAVNKDVVDKDAATIAELLAAARK
jgi:protein required for attachment to host cells